MSKSLETIIKDNPTSSVYTCMSLFVKGTNMNEELIRRMFKRFVPKSDYSKSDEEALINHLIKLSCEPTK